MVLESTFRDGFIKQVRDTLPGCIVMKADANYLQGVPDYLVLYKDKWAALELKRSASAKTQPNQSWYVEEMNKMSFSAFVSPENKDEVLHDLQQAFGAGGNSRVPKPK